MKKLGIQLYSYQSAEVSLDIKERIKISSEIGFNLVELAGGYDGISALEFNEILANNKVEVKSAHVALDLVEQQLEFLKEIGVKYVIVPYATMTTKEEALELAQKLNNLGAISAKYGMKMGYHNHRHEFVIDDEKYLMDYIIENTDPELVVIQLDCGWVSAAGVDPVEYINKYKGRIVSIHIKENDKIFDENTSSEDANCAQGQGIVDWNAVKNAADAQFDDILYAVEREASYNNPKNRVECLKADIKWINENL